LTAVAHGRTAARGALALLVAQSLTRIGGLVFVLIVTRQVAADQFSRYSIVAAVVLIGGFLADFGTTSAITRMVSAGQERAEDLLAGTLPASLALGGIAYAGAIGYAVLAGYPRQVVADIALGALALPLSSVAGSLLGVLDAVGRVPTRGALNAVQSLATTIGGAAAVIATGDVRWAIATVGLAPALTVVGGIAAVRRAGAWSGKVAWDAGVTARVLRLAVPIAISGGITAVWMGRDVRLQSVLSSAGETASYDLAARAVEACWFVGLAVAAPLLPVLAARTAAGDREGVERLYRAGIRAAHVAGLPISVLLAVLGTPVVRLAFGSGYGSVARPLAIVGAGYVLQFRAVVQGVLAEATSWLLPCVRRSAVALGLMVALDLALVPRWGAAGAAWGTVASGLCLTVLLARLYRSGGIATGLPSGRLLVATAGMAVVAWILRGEAVVAGAASLAVYVAMLLALGEVTRAEVNELRRRLRPASEGVVVEGSVA
jgi:O-antigen/teichoic acid export membrane protein